MAAKAHPVPALIRWLPPATAVATAIAALAGGEFLGPARHAAIAALVLQVTVEFYERRNRFLTSPLFLLSFITATLFSFVQGFWGRFVVDVLSVPSDLSVHILRLDPLWDPIRDHPRFQALLAKYEN